MLSLYTLTFAIKSYFRQRLPLIVSLFFLINSVPGLVFYYLCDLRKVADLHQLLSGNVLAFHVFRRMNVSLILSFAS